MEDHVEKVAMIAYLLFAGNMTDEQVEIMLICAYLHDAIEDSVGAMREYVMSVIKEEFSDCIHIILLLTHEEGVAYEGAYINNIAAEFTARKCKIADIMHNIHDKSTMRKKKLYREALDVLWKSELGLT